MVKIAIVDDEEEIGKHIEAIVKDYFKETQEVYEVRYYQQPENLTWDLADKKYYDIFLLDIEMNINGLEVAGRIRELYLEPYIVFVTSFVKYSVRGYEYGAYRYILKEEIDEKLPEALEFMCRELENRVYAQYVIESQSMVKKIDYKDIFYIYVEGKYSYFYTRNEEEKVRKSLAEVYRELDAPEFIYADKRYIINLQHVMTMGKRELLMRDGKVIVASVSQARKIREAISQYWGNKR